MNSVSRIPLCLTEAYILQRLLFKHLGIPSKVPILASATGYLEVNGTELIELVATV